MLPIAPLMIEHRLIERMITLIDNELTKIKENGNTDPNIPFLKRAVDFIQFYADKTHHGKEEDILFRELKKKSLSEKHTKIMNQLVADHKLGRQTTKALKKALIEYEKGDNSQLQAIQEKLDTLVQFYPQHIDTEDNHFFKAVMKYFSEEEQQALLEEGQIFDRKMIHRKYLDTVQRYEKEYGIKLKNDQEKWLAYM